MREISILDFARAEDIRHLPFFIFRNRERETLTKEEFLHLLKLAGGLKVYPGEPRSDVPHLSLDPGWHTGVYIETAELTIWPNIANILAYQAYCRILQEYEGRVDWVVGLSESVTPILPFLAERLKAKWRVFGLSTPDKSSMSFWNRFAFVEDEVVLAVHDVLLSPRDEVFGVFSHLKAQDKPRIKVLPFVYAIGSRLPSPPPGDGMKIVVSYDLSEFGVYERAECPYCLVKSPLVMTKTRVVCQEVIRRFWI